MSDSDVEIPEEVWREVQLLARIKRMDPVDLLCEAWRRWVDGQETP